MDKTNSITDSFSQGTSLVGGLLSQMNGNAMQNNLFSSLLSQSSELQASLAAIAQKGSPAPSSLSSQTTLSDPNQTSSSPAPSGLMQTLSDLSVTLHKVLAGLRQQQNKTSDNSPPPSQTTPQTTNPATVQSATQNSANTNPQGSDTNNTAGTTTADTTAPSAPPAPAVASGTDTAPPANTTQSTDAAASAPAPLDAQSLATIIAELLLLTQAMMKSLHQAQTTAGNATTGQVGSSPSDAAAVGALDATNALLSASPSTSTPPTMADAAPAPVTPTTDFTAQLQKMLTTLQKTVQELMPTQDAAVQANNVQNGSTDVLAAFSALEPTIATLDAALTKILKNQQQQNTDTSTAIAAALIQPTSTPTEKGTAKIATAPIPSLGASASATDTAPTTPSDPLAKTDLSNTQQSQILPLVSNAPTQLASSLTPGQTFSFNTALTGTAASSGGNAGADSDDGADLLSGGKNAPASAETNSAQTAGGAQAAGTYTFASTLSAARALNGGATGLPSPVDQVIVQINRSVKNGDDQISLQLHPADLGKITVKLGIDSDGNVQGSVTADNPQTLALLQKDSRSLERALQDAGLRTDPGSLQFNLGGQGNSGNNNAGQTANNNGGNNANAGNGNGTGNASDLTGLADMGSAAETYYLTPSGVNIRV